VDQRKDMDTLIYINDINPCAYIHSGLCIWG